MSRLHPAVASRPCRPFLTCRVTRVAITGAAALALAACGALQPPAGAGSGTAVTSASAPRSGARAAVAPPSFFADIAAGPLGGRGVLQVRDSATGQLVAQDQRVQATGLAALADGRTFVVAEPAGNSCATRLYRLRLNDRGQPGRPSRLQVPELHGELWSLAASGLLSVDDIPRDFPLYDELSANASGLIFDGGSGIVSPEGIWVSGPAVGREGLVTAQVDRDIVNRERLSLDPTGHYSRPDVLSTTVDRRRRAPTVTIDDP